MSATYWWRETYYAPKWDYTRTYHSYNVSVSSSCFSCCMSAPGQGPQGATGLSGSWGHRGQAAPHLQKHQLQTAGGQYAGPSLHPRCKNTHLSLHIHSAHYYTGLMQELQNSIQEMPLSQVNKLFQYKLAIMVASASSERQASGFSVVI